MTAYPSHCQFIVTPEENNAHGPSAQGQHSLTLSRQHLNQKSKITDQSKGVQTSWRDTTLILPSKCTAVDICLRGRGLFLGVEHSTADAGSRDKRSYTTKVVCGVPTFTSHVKQCHFFIVQLNVEHFNGKNILCVHLYIQLCFNTMFEYTFLHFLLSLSCLHL